MSNPVYDGGPIGYDAESKVERGRLVSVTADNKVSHAAATGAIIGAVTDNVDPDNVLSPDDVAVYYGKHTIKLAVAEGDAANFVVGGPVFAAADGFVSSAGTVKVGVVIRPSEDNRVLTMLTELPYTGE